jgi:hypothetical protein
MLSTTTAARRLAPLALAFALNVPVAQADTPVDLPADAVRRSLVVAADIQRLSDSPRELLLERVLQEAYAIDPLLPAAKAQAAIEGLRGRVTAADLDPLRGQPANAVIVALLVRLDAPHPEGAVGDALWRISDQALQDSARVRDGGSLFSVAADAGSTLIAGSFDAAAVLARSAELAEDNAAFAQARDALWGETASFSVLDTTAELRDAASALQAPELAPVLDLIGPDDAIHTTSEAVDGLAEAQFALLDQAASQAIASVNSPWPADQLAAERAAREAKASGAKAATGVLADVAGALNSPAAKRIVGTQKMLSQALGAYERWSESARLAGLTNGDKWARLSTVGMTGSVLGAVTMIGPVLGIDSAEAQTLKALAQISKQLTELRTEMHERFDRIDTKLDILGERVGALDARLLQVQDRLEDLASAVEATNGNVDQALRSLDELKVSVDRLQQNLYRVSADELNTQVWQTINASIGYRDLSASGDPLPAEGFSDAAASLFTFGTTTARGETLQPIAGRVFTADARLSEIDKVDGIEGDAEFLRRLPSATPGWNLPKLGRGTSEVVVNARHWAVAARAFSQLLLENTDRVTPAQLDRLGGLIDAGRAARAVQRDVATLTAGSTRSGSALFNRILDDYTEQLSELGNAMEEEKTAYLDGLAGVAPNAGNPGVDMPAVPTTKLKIDLWGGPDQALYPEAEMGANEGETNCDWDGNGVDPDWAPNYGHLPQQAKLARHLGIAQITFCQKGHSLMPYAYWSLRFLDGRQVGDDRRSIFDWSLNGDFDRRVIDVGLFGGEDAQTMEEQLAPIRAAINENLRKRQRGLYVKLAERAGSESPLHSALVRLEGTTRLLEAYLDLGLGDARGRDERLQDLLTDGGRPLDVDTFVATFSALGASGSPVPATAATSVLLAQQRGRVSEIEQAISAWLAVPAANQTAKELEPTGSALVDATLARLELTATVLTHRPAAPVVAPVMPPVAAPEESPAPPPAASDPRRAMQPPAATPTPSTEPAQLPVTLTKVTLAKRRFRRVTGTKLRFTLSRAATVTVTLSRRGAKTTRRFTGRAGANSIAFGKRLERGNYTARVAAGASLPATLRFTVR